MDDKEKFAEKELPRLQHWSDVLNEGKVAASEADLKNARKNFREFKSHNL